MQAIGFHFGHDASCARMGSGGLTGFLDKERRTRVKHALGLSADDLRAFLADAPAETLLALSSTQEMPIFLPDGVDVSVEGGTPLPLAEFRRRMPADHHYWKYAAWMPDADSRRGVHVAESAFPFAGPLNEGFNRSYAALAAVKGQHPGLARAQAKPAELTLDGRTWPARFYQHHYLHALYAAWAVSADRPSLVITGDGGIGPTFCGGGIYFWLPGQRLWPITPADGWLGYFYDSVSVVLGFDRAGGAGKLMGLAPYGRPIYFSPRLVGTRYEITEGYTLTMWTVIRRWLAQFGVDPAALPKWDPFSERPPTVIADIAASAQLILEMNIQALAGAAVKVAANAGFEFETVTLCGGVALNCPANSNLAVTLGKPVLVPPACNDEGLSIGGAVAAWFDLAGAYPAAPASYAEAAYIGTDVTRADVAAAAARHGWRKRRGDPLALAARLLLADELVGLCCGRAEVGPRALGHRSILANPASTGTWAAANRLKRREPWRPFAPAVLHERSASWFSRGPDESRYMLFTYRCDTKRLPAITHYDHSARVQHVSPETGILYDLLRTLEAEGAPPVVLNTSFNGPGVPIVDTAEDAFAEAGRLGLKHILTDDGLYSAG
jgi:carbamoyltransferase